MASMTYRSTKGGSEGRSFADVVLEGVAPDGGLYLPTQRPAYEPPAAGSSHVDFVEASLQAFGAENVSLLVGDAFARFNHPDITPLRTVGEFHLLEMFWGPTLSFKDHALQVLGRLFDRYLSERGEQKTVLVATSGDTGSAAIEGFRGLDSVRIVVLYPSGMVSDYQRRQMTTITDDNVTVLEVLGDFDDCQRLVKEAFAINAGLTSANSINWGRIASQVGYYLSLGNRIDGPFDVVIPTGNFGNAYSARVAASMGIAIRRITVATNSNNALYELHRSGSITPGSAVATLAPAMDIRVPSNLERYLDHRTEAEFSEDFGAGWADDNTILETIKKVYDNYHGLIDPHTAVAWSVAEGLGEPDVPRVIVSTAHPVKFAPTIAKAVGFDPETPEWGRIDPSLDEHLSQIEPDIDALLAHL